MGLRKGDVVTLVKKSFFCVASVVLDVLGVVGLGLLDDDMVLGRLKLFWY